MKKSTGILITIMIILYLFILTVCQQPVDKDDKDDKDKPGPTPAATATPNTTPTPVLTATPLPTPTLIPVNLNLKSLTVTCGTLSPIFDAAVLEYSLLTANKNFKVTASAEDTGALILIKINNGPYVPLDQGVESGILDLNLGTNLLKVYVRMDKISRENVYSLQINRFGVDMVGSPETEYKQLVITDKDGNVYMAGSTSGSPEGTVNAGTIDFFLTRYTPGGTKEWTKLYGDAVHNYCTDLAVDRDGNIYIAGVHAGLMGGRADISVYKINPSGSLIQTVALLQPTGYEELYGMTVDGSGNIYLTGSTGGDLHGEKNAGQLDIFIIKYNPQGTRLWTKLMGTTVQESSEAITTDVNGNVYITGYTYGSLGGTVNAGSADIFVTKLNAQGVVQWTGQLGNSYYESARDIAVDSQGNVYICGITNANLDGIKQVGSTDIFIIKYNQIGEKQWTVLTGTTVTDNTPALTVNGKGDVYLTSYTWGSLTGQTNSGMNDILLFKYSTAGKKLWEKMIGTTADDNGYDIVAGKLGNIFVTGNTRGNLNGIQNKGVEDAFIFNVDSEGNTFLDAGK